MEVFVWYTVSGGVVWYTKQQLEIQKAPMENKGNKQGCKEKVTVYFVY